MQNGIWNKKVCASRLPVSDQYAKGLEGWIGNGCFLHWMLVHKLSNCICSVDKTIDIFIQYATGLVDFQSVRPTAGVTGKGGIWRTKPPDAESAVGAADPESVGERPHLSGARGVGRSAASTHARYQITSKPRQTPVLLSYPKFCLNILCASSLVIVEYSGCPLGR